MQVVTTLIVPVVGNYLISNTNAAGLLKTGCYINDGQFSNCNIHNFSNSGIDTTFFQAFVQSKTVVLYYYFCGITDLILVEI